MNDTCISGECVGVVPPDPCEMVTCPLLQCRLEPTCINGTCFYENEDELTDCDDGNSITVDDVCINGVCQGVDKCANVSCPASGCLAEGTCNIQTGECNFPLAPNGFSCDDGDSTTVSDHLRSNSFLIPSD